MKYLENLQIKRKIAIMSYSNIFITIFILVGFVIFGFYLKQNIKNMQKQELKFRQISIVLDNAILTFHKNIIITNFILSSHNKEIIKDNNEYIKNMQDDNIDLHDNIIDYLNILEILLKQNITKNNKNIILILKKLKIRYFSYYNIIKDMNNASNDEVFDILIGVNAIYDKMREELDVFEIVSKNFFLERIKSIQLHLLIILISAGIFFLIALMLIFYMNKIFKRTIHKSLNILDNGISNFFNFLTEKTKNVDEIKILYNDEIGKVIDHINSNIHEAEMLINNEKNFKVRLQFEVEKQTKELRKLHSEIIDTQKDVIVIIGSVVELRSKETGYHIKRVVAYSQLFARLYGLNQKECDLITMASPMHDIGKIGIPDSILLKPGGFSDDEFEIMKTHVIIGHNILKDSSRPIMQAAAIIAHEHHERWDGKGYPRGLKEEGIHIFGRITAIADIFDALGSKRVYKDAWPLEKILDFFKAEKGRFFEPKLVDIFFNNLDQFIDIRDSYSDTSIKTTLDVK